MTRSPPLEAAPVILQPAPHDQICATAALHEFRVPAVHNVGSARDYLLGFAWSGATVMVLRASGLSVCLFIGALGGTSASAAFRACVSPGDALFWVAVGELAARRSAPGARHRPVMWHPAVPTRSSGRAGR